MGSGVTSISCYRRPEYALRLLLGSDDLQVVVTDFYDRRDWRFWLRRYDITIFFYAAEVCFSPTRSVALAVG